MPAEPAKREGIPYSLLLLIAGFFVLSTALNVANPIWESIDEPGHFQYAKFVAEQHRLPTRGDSLPSLATGYADCVHVRCVARGEISSEAPLYYLLVAPFIMPIDLNKHVSWVANPYFTWAGHPLRNGVAIHTLSEQWPYRGMVLGVHLLRALSALMVGGAIVATYFTARTIGASRRFGLLAAGTGAVTPGILLSSASVNNDNAAILMGSLALLFAARALTATAGRAPWLALYVGAALLGLEAKTTAYFLVPVSLVLALLLIFRPGSGGRTGGAVLLASAAGLGVLAVLAVRSTHYDIVRSLRGVGKTLSTVGQNWPCTCSLPGEAWWGALPNLWVSYWASYGWETFHPDGRFYRPLLAVSIAAVVGLIVWTVRGVRCGPIRLPSKDGRVSAIFLLAFAFATLLLIVNYRYWESHSTGGSTHGRFLFPTMLAISFFITLGLYSLPGLVRTAGFVMLFGACLGIWAYSVYVLPRSFGPTLPVYGDATAAQARTLTNVKYASGMELVGWSLLDDKAVLPGQTLHLRLFWGATTPPDFDYSAFVRLVDNQGQHIQGPDHGPGAEIDLPAHNWRPGEVVPDDWAIPIPPSAQAGSYEIQLGVYDYRDLRPILTLQGQESLSIGSQTIGAAPSAKSAEG